ncbi:MAG: rod shape-determining protein MreD [Acidobacteriota bacterium]
MTKKQFRLIFAILLLFMQIVINRSLNEYNINIDFLFLILVFVSFRDNFIRTIIVATIIGWITDVLSSNVLGVYGFSRVVIAFLLFEIVKYIDFKKLSFTFIIVFSSLSISNLIANIFFLFIYNYSFSVSLLVFQPLLTSLLAVLLITSGKLQKTLNVY